MIALAFKPNLKGKITLATMLVVGIILIIKRKTITYKIKRMKENFLTKNFTLEELTRTNQKADNTPNEQEVNNLKNLAEKILQPLRNYFNKPIIVSSGFRSELVNELVGGSDTSDHRHGRAGDIKIKGVTNEQLIEAVKKLNLPYDQIINEKKWRKVKGKWVLIKWVHISYNPQRDRREHLTANNTKTDLVMRYKLVA